MNSAITYAGVNYIDVASVFKKLMSLCLAAIMTVTLLYMMYFLIKNDAVPEEVKPTPPMPSINMTIDEDIVTRPEEIKIIKPVVRTLPPVVHTRLKPETKTLATSIFEPVEIELPKTFNPMAVNSQPMPMVRVSPVYPHAAAAKRIQGFVDVMFDVTETGAVENVKVVYAEPEKIFNSAVLKSVARWKYKPKMEEGVAMKMFGLRERIRFNMEN